MTTQATSMAQNPTNSEKQLTRNWIIFGMIAGIIGDFAYASAIAPIPLPESAKMYLGMFFGPLLSLAFIGMYHFFRLNRKTVILQTATIFDIIAGTIVNLMFVVQSAIYQTITVEAQESLGLVFKGLNMVQLGMDVSWDIYFSLTTILLGVEMFRHPRFGWIWGAVSLLIGGGLLVLNLATFPTPPANANLIDLGPVSGLLFLFVSIRVLTSLKWVDEKLNP